jgi:hypothetical protein
MANHPIESAEAPPERKENIPDVVRAASFRAKVRSYVYHLGRPISSHELLDHMKPTYEGMGLTRAGAAYHLRTMSNNGELGVLQKGPHSMKRFTKPEAESITASVDPDDALPAVRAKAAAEPRPPAHHHAAMPMGAAEMEFQVPPGATIVCGINPATGRFRVKVE